MRIEDFYPTQGAFVPGATITFKAQISQAAAGPLSLRLKVNHLNKLIAASTVTLAHQGGLQAHALQWSAPPENPRGYGVTVELLAPSGRVSDSASSAFDVLPDWTAFPRYGFLSDFAPGRNDMEATLAELARFHINGLQFYDWQYRHDHLLSSETNYTDPLDRALSLDTVSDFINAAHKAGMAAMPYLAVYAASLPFWSAHPAWALYDEEGRPASFLDFLGLMDPSPGSGWTGHLLEQCRLVLAALPFDGFHVDQYGDPQQGWTAAGQEIDLPAAFVAFIGCLKESHPASSVLFNAVGNWPIEALTSSALDFNYIEIWPPDVHYKDLRRIVSQARRLSAGKPVTIALYLPADQIQNVRLADALIFALGGSRIELGEAGRLLGDPYFPKHQAIGKELRQILRAYYDFAIRYGELIGPAATDEAYPVETTQPGVWTNARHCPGWLAVNLVNMAGLGEPRWDEPLPDPAKQDNLVVRLHCPQPVVQVWWASPDRDTIDLEPLDHYAAGGEITVTLPDLQYWALIAIELAISSSNETSPADEPVTDIIESRLSHD